MAASTARSLKESVRFLWIFNREPAGLVVAVLLMVALATPVIPLGRSIPLTGVVTAINVQGGKRQPAFNAWVDLGGSQTVVGLPLNHECVVGSPIALEKTPTLLGGHYAISGKGCGAAPAVRR